MRKLSRHWVNQLEGATIGIPMEEHTDFFFRPSQTEWEENCKLDWEFGCSYFLNQASLTFGIKKRTKAGYIIEGIIVEQGRNYLVTIKKNVIVWKPLYNCKIVYTTRKETKLW